MSLSSRRFYRLVVALCVLAGATAHAATKMPARFVDDRVIVNLMLTHHRVLRMWSDTGGGTTIIDQDAARRLELSLSPIAALSGYDDLPPGTMTLARPLPLMRSHVPPPPDPVLVMADPPETKSWSRNTDGNLGQNWWAGHIWTWDYPAGALWLEDERWAPPKAARVIPVTFRAGVHFSRITITVAGEPISMLLDTGATTYLTEDAARQVGGARLQATSMITASRIEAWHAAHPDWPIIDRAQVGFGSRMIRVPDVRIGGLQLGPVWFTQRADANFLDGMSRMTDARVEGAIGGNAFHTLRMTVDYIHGRAALEQPAPPQDMRRHGGR